MKHLLIIGTLATAIPLSGEALAVCSGTQITDTNSASTETANIAFQALPAGKSITIAGLTVTANTNRSPAQVGNAYRNLANGATTGTGLSFTYTGKLTGWSTTNTTNSPRVFISASSGNVPDIAVSTTGTMPTITTTQGGGLPSISTLLTGNTVCVGSPGNWEAQEFHKSDGNLIDYKKGPSDPVDPTASVGSWSISGTGAATRVNYTYGTTTYNNAVWDHGDGTYSFCNQEGNETIPSAIKAGQTGC